MRKYLVASVTRTYIGGLYLFLPLMPLLATLLFWRRKYALQYLDTISKMRVHIKALAEGPVEHYFGDVLGRVSEVPVEIKGECVQCGNCCMDKRCVFLEQVAADKHQCGIYHSPFRRLSNCGSFPLSKHDIDRYACPSYYVAGVQPIKFVRNVGDLQMGK